MTLLPSLLLVLVAGCHAQVALFPAFTYPLAQQPRLHYVPLVPYYQPLIQPQVYNTSGETSGTPSAVLKTKVPFLHGRGITPELGI